MKSVFFTGAGACKKTREAPQGLRGHRRCYRLLPLPIRFIFFFFFFFFAFCCRLIFPICSLLQATRLCGG
jgi:hypothetical protein